MSHESECSESWQQREREAGCLIPVCRFPCVEMSMPRKGGWMTDSAEGPVAEARGEVDCFS